MKAILFTTSCLLLLLNLAACGKKAEVNDKDGIDKTLLPSDAEVYFNSFKEIERAVLENDLQGLEDALANNAGVDLNQILNDGNTFLTLSIKNDFLEIRNLLIEKGANLNRANVNKETPLIVAVNNKRLNSVKVLLDLKVELDKKDAAGNTALHIALKKNYDEIALLIIKQGANLEVTDKNERNAIRLAQEYNCVKAHQLIRDLLQVEVGAPDLANFRNIIAQSDAKRLASVLARYPRIVTDYESINPLAILVDAKDNNSALRSAEILLEYQANVNGPKDADLTPLIRATQTSKKGFAHLYLSARANPQLLDKDGKSALIFAIELNNLELVDLLLSYSAVEKYTFRKDGKKITYDACSVAKNVDKGLTDNKAKEINKSIRKSLNCSILSWLF